MDGLADERVSRSVGMWILVGVCVIGLAMSRRVNEPANREAGRFVLMGAWEVRVAVGGPVDGTTCRWGLKCGWWLTLVNNPL